MHRRLGPFIRESKPTGDTSELARPRLAYDLPRRVGLAQW